jgi:hypothetical protein
MTKKKTDKPTTKREEGGHFAPGTSGNPGGRPAIPAEFKSRGPKRLERMEKIASSPKHKHYYAALVWCLERQYGKAVQSVDVESTAFDAVVERILTGGGKIDIEAELGAAKPKAKP